jgi:hypothetical protein
MGILEAINRHPRRVSVALGAVILISGTVIASQMRGGAGAVLAKHAYFTDDDGKSFFVDDASNIPPFDHNGKEAVAAHVFATGHDSPFVGYMERAVTPAARDGIEKAREELLQDAAKQAVPMPSSELIQRIRQNTEVKRPGDTKWIAATSKAVRAIYAVSSPAGSSDVPHEVLP